MATKNAQPVPVESADIEAALAARDKRLALRLIMSRLGKGIYRFAVAMTGDCSLAEDVRQQVFVDAYRGLDNFTAGTSIQSWIFGIARHRCFDAVSARARWFERYKNEPPEEPEHDSDPGRELDRGRLARVLAGCLSTLAPPARDAVLLRYQQELSYEQAAVIAGELPGTLQRRVVRALPVLRRCIKARLLSGGSR